MAQTQILPYLINLAKRKVEVYILSFEKRQDLPQAEGTAQRLNRLNIKWFSLPYHRRWGNLWDIFAGMIKTFKLVKREQIPLIHVRASIPLLIGWPVAKLLRRKIIYDRRGTMVGDLLDNPSIKNSFTDSTLAAIEKFIIKRSDAVVVLSKKALNELKQDLKIEQIIEDIPCCADMSKFRDAQGSSKIGSNGRFVVSYLGSLGTCYLLKEMAQFFKALKQKKQDALFLIISHTQREIIDEVLRKENVTDYSVVSVVPDEVPKYMVGSDASVMFIQPWHCKIASSPTKFAESLAAGVPVVVNKGIGDTEDIINKYRVGAVIEDFNKDSYQKAASQILSLLEEEGIKNRCWETAEKHFSLDMGVEKYAAIYQRLSNG